MTHFGCTARYLDVRREPAYSVHSTVGVTGGLAAPLIATGMGAIIGTAGGAALGSAAGIAVIGSLFGVAGAGLTGNYFYLSHLHCIHTTLTLTYIP